MMRVIFHVIVALGFTAWLVIISLALYRYREERRIDELVAELFGNDEP